jgi:hypothetical protein
MNENDPHDQPHPLDESKRRGVIARLFSKFHAAQVPIAAYEIGSDTLNTNYGAGPSKENKPDYFNPVVVIMDEAELRETFNGMGIERGPEHTHILHYVGGISIDDIQNPDQSFSEYAQEHDLGKPREVVSRYTGDLTDDDKDLIVNLLKDGESGRAYVEAAEMNKLSPNARTFMNETIVARNLHYHQALELIRKDQSEPLAFYHGIDQDPDLREDEKVLFWIDETYGGEISLDVGPTYNDMLAGPTADGQVNVNIRGKAAGALYWNTWRSNAVRWSVDPFLRSVILAENPYNQTRTQL